MSLINDALKRAHQQQQNQPPRVPGVPLQPVNYDQRGPNPWIFFAVIPLVILLLGLVGWYLLTPSKSKAVRVQGVNTVKQATSPLRQTSGENAVSVPASAFQPPSRNIEVRHASGVNVVTAPAIDLRPPPAVPTSRTETKLRAAVAAPTNLAVRTKPIPASTPAESRVPSVARETPVAPPTLTPAVTPAVASENPVAPPVAATTTPETRAAFPTLKLQGIYYRLNNPSVLINGRTLFIGDRIEGARIVKIERQNVTVEFSGQTKVIEL
ncbi:MAG: general secretion pathway protein GspB [Verrucomicrobia bacterium]|nr:general secretion pathway protein GspB [Verrucomicrobiota bacterium]